ncbi:MAG: hypothetical protein LC800_02280 [Acidobacteria bacterium]|nr:hypothetical protein [Acidobacteriota bacterium]
MKTVPRRLSLACLLAASLLPHAPAARGQSQTRNAPPDSAQAAAEKLDALLERVSGRVRAYHERLFSIAFSETVRQERLRHGLTPKGKPGEFVYDSLVLRRSARAGAEATALPVVTRRLKSRDGKAVNEKKEAKRQQARAEKPGRPCGITDPPTAYGDPLLFLLPENRPRLNFSDEGEAALDGRAALVVAFESPPAAAPPELKFEDNCFFLSRPLRRRGRVWIDPQTYDVLRLDWELAETFEAKTGNRVVRKGILFRFAPTRELSYERDVMTIRFRPVAFKNPAQTLLLPVSSESLRVMRGARDPGFRVTQTYADYRRYVTSSEVRETDDDPR